MKYYEEEIKKGTTFDTFNNLGARPENYAALEKPTPKVYILYDSIYITFWKQHNYRKEKTN